MPLALVGGGRAGDWVSEESMVTGGGVIDEDDDEAPGEFMVRRRRSRWMTERDTMARTGSTVIDVDVTEGG